MMEDLSGEAFYKEIVKHVDHSSRRSNLTITAKVSHWSIFEDPNGRE